MKTLALATIIALSASTTAWAQSATTPVNPNANPNNCSPAFPNCASTVEGNNKTPGNTPGTSRNEMRQEGQTPQTATEPDLPMKSQDCAPGQSDCTPAPSGGMRPAPGATQ